MTRIGILGGTFNPPHNGHVKLAEAAFAALDLAKLVVVPAGTPPHKALDDDPGADVRFALSEAAFGGLEGVEVSRLEVDRDGPSWMIDTLRSVGEANPDSELVLILGEDAALSLPSWKEPEQIVALAQIAWVERVDGLSNGDVSAVVRGLGAEAEAVLLEMESVPVSSTEVRALAAADSDLSEFVPPDVSALISERGLYHQS